MGENSSELDDITFYIDPRCSTLLGIFALRQGKLTPLRGKHWRRITKRRGIRETSLSELENIAREEKIPTKILILSPFFLEKYSVDPKVSHPWPVKKELR